MARPGPRPVVRQRIHLHRLSPGADPMLPTNLPCRRDMLATAGTGFGLLALADLLAAEEKKGAASDRASSPYAVRKPHHAARAKRVIFLYMPGGPSHVDLFDPKPRLAKDNGKPLPFAKP